MRAREWLRRRRRQRDAERLVAWLAAMAEEEGSLLAAAWLLKFTLAPRDRWPELADDFRDWLVSVARMAPPRLRAILWMVSTVLEEIRRIIESTCEAGPTGEQYEGEEVDLGRCVRCPAKVDPDDLLGLCDACRESLRDGIAGEAGG